MKCPQVFQILHDDAFHEYVSGGNNTISGFKILHDLWFRLYELKIADMVEIFMTTHISHELCRGHYINYFRFYAARF